MPGIAKLPSMRDSEAARRAYWTEQFEDAYRFMFHDILPYPVQECGEHCVSLPEAASAAGVEVHFSDKPHVQQLERLFYLREGQIPGFVGAAREMNQRGWILKVEDGYRTRTIQKYLGRTPQVFDAVLRSVMWELGGKVPTPEFMFRRCSALVATVPKFGTHMSGSAIDISVLWRDDPAREVDRGAPYIEMSALTPMASPFVSVQARQNRHDITAVMERHGFVAYPWEFWHYSSGDAYDQFLRGTGQPARYGAVDLDPATGAVTALDRPTEPLNSEEEVRAEIEAALKRNS
jgi:D-alanyl-D-alanine dipeptidase